MRRRIGTLNSLNHGVVEVCCRSEKELKAVAVSHVIYARLSTGRVASESRTHMSHFTVRYGNFSGG